MYEILAYENNDTTWCIIQWHSLVHSFIHSFIRIRLMYKLMFNVGIYSVRSVVYNYAIFWLYLMISFEFSRFVTDLQSVGEWAIEIQRSWLRGLLYSILASTHLVQHLSDTANPIETENPQTIIHITTSTGLMSPGGLACAAEKTRVTTVERLQNKVNRIDEKVKTTKLCTTHRTTYYISIAWIYLVPFPDKMTAALLTYVFYAGCYIVYHLWTATETASNKILLTQPFFRFLVIISV